MSMIKRYKYAIITGILIIASYLLFTLQYETNDDSMIMNYISGLYTGRPEIMPFYMEAPYSYLISCLYMLTTRISWYSVAFLVINAASVIAISMVLMQENDSPAKYLMFLGVILALYLYCLVNLQYTTVAGFAGAAACAIICGMEQEDSKWKRRWQIAGAAIFMFLCYTIRNQSMQVVVLVLVLILAGNKLLLHKRIKNQLMAFIACMIVIALSYGCNTIYIRHTGWEDYARLQTVRGGYMDYECPPYEGNEELYASVGWDEESTELIRNWCFRLDEANVDDFTQLNEMIEENKQRDIGSMLQRVVHFIHGRQRETAIMGIEIVWILLILLYAWRTSDNHLLRCGLYAAGFLALEILFIVYLIWIGRYKERAMNMTFFICATPMFMILIDTLFGKERIHRSLQCISAVLMLILALMGCRHVADREIFQYDALDQAEAYVLANKDNIYMGDTELASRQRMFRSFDADSTLTNLFWWGIWMEGTPFDKEQLQLNGLDSLDLEDMLEENHYYIGVGTNSMELLNAYYTSRYENVTCSICYRTDEIVVYCFRQEL